MNSSYCFVAGTAVLTACGYVAIEDIAAGDMVYAWDEETGTVGIKEVVETYINETPELIHVFVGGEEIITTPSHPFYSPVKGWTDAVHLRAGDILVTVNGELVVVEKIQHEILESPITVYNFQVEGYHTYYVSGIDILVHNSCNNPGGRHGGQAHRAKVNDVKQNLTSKGWDVSREDRGRFSVLTEKTGDGSLSCDPADGSDITKDRGRFSVLTKKQGLCYAKTG